MAAAKSYVERREARRRAAVLRSAAILVALGTPRSWRATAPLWVARNQQPSTAAEGEVFGHLTCEPSGWTWKPAQRGRRLGALTLHWANADDLHVSFAPVWGLTPSCQVTLSVGPRALDLWVRGRASDVRNAVATSQMRG